MTQPAMTPQQKQFSGAANQSRLELYRKLAVGGAGYLGLVHYEISQFLFSNAAGLPGLAVRAVVYPALFAECGKKIAFGRSLVIRRAKQTKLGSNIVIDDFASLDAREDDAEITLGDFVTIGRFTTLAAKGGKIYLDKAVNVGSYCRIATNSRIEIGESVLIGAYSYIGPGNHQQGDEHQPLISKPMDIRGGVKIGDHTWIGTRATILDGVSIGKNVIIGAHSLVKDDIPDNCVAAGVPARIIKSDLSRGLSV